jgi:hypothetical protein
MRKKTHMDALIGKAPPTLPLLPLVHTCEAYDFRSILYDAKISLTPCSVFKKEHLSYFFYGRPAYRTAKGTKSVSSACFFPVCILIEIETFTKPKRIFPFDTGAFTSGLFGDYFHRKMQLKDFALKSDITTPAKVVSFFYGSNVSYYNGTSQFIALPPLEFEAQCYYELIRNTRSTQFDDRRSSIEVQSNHEVILGKDIVKLVILPTVFLDYSDVVDIIMKEWGSELRTYHINHCSPNEYMSLIYKEVRDYLIVNGYM